tara:strand:- start:3569 stop:4168 length:600 start_codon:yes stop_codon:yes gene_type:complete
MLSRIISAIMVLILGICALPLMAALALLLLCFQGRPILFRQARSGYHQQTFTLVKFRTMRNTKNSDGQLLPDDLRMTGIGRFIRRTRLDELPELWNIWRGEMAFVGPRPLLPDTVASFGKNGDRRAMVPPGLTGWAQINGNTLLSQHEKLDLDLWYVERHTLMLDISIIIRTVKMVLLGEKINKKNLEQAIARSHYRSR